MKFYDQIKTYITQDLLFAKYVFFTNYKYIYYPLFIVSLLACIYQRNDLICLSICLVCLLLSGYLLLYYYLQIPFTILSFVSFSLNILFGAFFIYGLFNILFNGLPKPIFVEQLSSFSKYRYLVMVVLYFMAFCLFCLSLKVEKLKNIITIVNFSVLKKEFVNIVKACPHFELFLNKSCTKILNIIASSSTGRLFYFSMHFIFTYLYRFILLIFFINFCFFHGDLRYVLYFMPFSFLLWLFSFIRQYFSWFFEDNLYCIRDVFTVTIKDKNAWSVSQDNNFQTRPSNLIFELTPYALKERKYSVEHVPALKKVWFQFSDLARYFELYEHRVSFLSYILLGAYYICWFSLCYDFFEPTNILCMTFNPLGGFFNIIRRSYHTTKPLFIPRKGYAIDESVMNSLKENTKGKYSPGHFVYGDSDPATGTILAEGHLTTDKKNRIPDAQKISDKNLKGDCVEQKVVPFEGVQPIAQIFTREIIGSETFFTQKDVKYLYTINIKYIKARYRERYSTSS